MPILRYAVIDGENALSGLVENVILANSGFPLPGKTLVQSNTVGPGWTWNGGNSFTEPPDPEIPAPKINTPIVQSPDGTMWSLTIDDSGRITTKEIA